MPISIAMASRAIANRLDPTMRMMGPSGLIVSVPSRIMKMTMAAATVRNTICGTRLTGREGCCDMMELLGNRVGAGMLVARSAIDTLTVHEPDHEATNAEGDGQHDRDDVDGRRRSLGDVNGDERGNEQADGRPLQ